MKDPVTPSSAKEGTGMSSALEGSALEGAGPVGMQPPAFQLKAEGKEGNTQEASSAPIQRYVDATEVVGNVSAGVSASRGLNEVSQRRVIERIAQLRGQDATAAGAAFMEMDERHRREALRTAIRWFQESEQGRALIREIRGDNAVESGGETLYGMRESGRRSQYPAPTADYRRGVVSNNDVTMQALANAWPRNFLGRMLQEAQAYTLIRRLLALRSLPFDPQRVNVVSVRAFQGGEIHDNNEGESNGPFSQRNVFNDTTFILSMQDGVPQVVESRSTVDPGDANRGESELDATFRVEADQQWRYSGYSNAHSTKFDRPMYDIDRSHATEYGLYWEQHPERLAQAMAAGEAGGQAGSRVISNRSGDLSMDMSSTGSVNRVSALHSGGGSRHANTVEVLGESTGCTVVHGAWFPHFNESLRRAAGTEGHLQFTYSLLDLRLVDAATLRATVAAV